MHDRSEVFRRTLFWSIVSAVCLLRLWWADFHDLTAAGQSRYDDQLFVDRAAALLGGEWLGPYTERTLIKGPFYSWWIAGTSAIGVPLLLAQQAFYTAASVTLVGSLGPVIGGRPLQFILLGALLLNPAALATYLSSSVIRVGVQPALAMLVFAAAIGLASSSRSSRFKVGLWAAFLGGAGACYSLNREDGVWIVAGIVPLLVAGACANWRQRRLGRYLIVGTVLSLAVFCGIRGWVRVMNQQTYGKAVITETMSSDFLAAYGALSRIRDEERPERVPVSKKMRSRAYSVSPALAGLEEVMEHEIAPRWGRESCRSAGVCDDIAGGWFIWALREAVAREGHHSSAAAAGRFYRQVADEIDAACDAGTLACTRRRATLRPPLTGSDVGPLAKRFLEVGGFLGGFQGLTLGEGDSWGSSGSLAHFSLVTHERLALAAEREFGQLVAGQAASRDGRINFSVHDCLGREVPGEVTVRRSPALAEGLRTDGRDWSHAKRGRFSVWVPKGPVCSLVLTVESERRATIPIDRRARRIDRQDLYALVAPTRPSEEQIHATGGRRPWRARASARVARVFSWVAPVAAAMAVLVWVIWTVSSFRNRSLEVAWVIASSLLAAVAALAGLVALVDLTSYPAINVRYLAPAYPLLLSFCVVGIGVGRERVRMLFGSKSGDAS